MAVGPDAIHRMGQTDRQTGGSQHCLMISLKALFLVLENLSIKIANVAGWMATE